MFEIKHYLTDEGRDLFAEWRSQLSDNKAKLAVDRRIFRVELGNFGDHRPCQDGVWEFRIDLGPGYRIYYAQTEKSIILLFCGGTKRSQKADIEKACKYWKDWQDRYQENK